MLAPSRHRAHVCCVVCRRRDGDSGADAARAYARRVPENDPFAQSAYQVRLEWGTDGLDRLAPADIVVVVDVLRFSSSVIAAAEAGDGTALDDAAHAVSLNGAAVAAAAASAGHGEVVIGGLRNAAAVARHVLARQAERGARTSVAVIAAGERVGGEDHRVRFAVEDQLGAGAVIAALGDLGIDHCSPEAAVAGEGFRALRGAARHLLTASGSGRELAAVGRADEVLAAAAVDAASVVPVLRDGVFTPA
jgi:2-phosphosulfolactate phosphatase